MCRYSKLAWLKKANIIAFNSALVRVFTFLRLAPAGIKDVHDMLVKVATSLIRGGETGKADLFFQSKAFLSHVTLPALTSTRGDMFSQISYFAADLSTSWEQSACLPLESLKSQELQNSSYFTIVFTSEMSQIASG